MMKLVVFLISINIKSFNISTMKKIKHIRLPLSIFFYLLIIGNIASAQNAWRKIGDIMPEEGSGFELSIAIDSNNVPYVAYQESGRFTTSPYNGLTVKKFNGTTWQFVGQRTFSGSTYMKGINIAINRQNIPYVAYSMENSGTNNNFAFFRLDKFNGTSWDMLIQNSGQIGYQNALIIDRNNDPYVAYIRDANTTALAISTLGPSGASTNSLTGFSPDFAVDNNNMIYVVYHHGPFNTPFVKRYNGASWEFVGPPTGINFNASGICRIAIDHNNVPYVVAENTVNLTITVQKFIGTDWEQVGATGFAGIGMVPNIAIDNNNVPYVIYNDYRNGYQVYDPHYLGLTVQKFNGTAWELVGQRTFSTINAMSVGTSIVFGKNNVAYVATATIPRTGNFWKAEAYYFGPPTFPAITLPVRLLSFEVNVVQETAVINWSTATETNNEFFTIERSQDGVSFTAVARINASGNSNRILQYTHTDAHPFTGRSYYRLKQTDIDGKHTYSDIRVVNIQPNQKVQVFPGNDAGSFTIAITNPTRTMQIEIYNLAGILIYKTATVNQVNTVSLNSQAKGPYIIKVIDGKEIVAVQKIIK
jgi:hypothetical protein